MKSLSSVIVGLFALATPALAADMSMPVKSMPPPAFTWSGCYLGVHGGGGWQTSSWTSGNFAVASGVGWLGGGQIGCNLQWRQFVIGVEGELWGSNLYDRAFDQSATFFSDAFSRNRWDAAVSVRAGITFERAWIYGKLGAIQGKFDYSSDVTLPGFFETIRGSATFNGVLIGIGFEYAIFDNWTVKFEYDHIDFGNKVVDFTDVRCAAGVCTTTVFSSAIKETKEIAKIGLNFKFP